MIRNAVLILFLLFGSAANGQTNVTVKWQNIERANYSDSIYYSADRKLNWNDFNGKPNAASPAAAITESGFGYKLSMNSLNNRTSIIVTVFCYFNKRKSWVKPGMNTNYALLHEQHHFDITYINTVLFVQKLKEARFNLNNYQSLIDKIYNESFESLDKMQNDYDHQTSNGRLKQVQSEWNKKIDELLTLIPIN